MTTCNMSLDLSDCFWRMGKDSAESQVDAFRSDRFNLIIEWRNTSTRIKELDHDELFEKKRNFRRNYQFIACSYRSAEKYAEKKLWNMVATQIRRLL